MADIGKLFKVISNDLYFLDLCQNTELTNEEILQTAFHDESFITNLRSIINDDNIIKSKMEIIIGQKRKTSKKPIIQEKEELEKEEKEKDELEDKKEEEEKTNFISDPINLDKVTYLGNFAFIERVDYRMRLVTKDFEVFY